MELQKRKIVIVGAGHVGSHAGYALISQGLCEEIVYIDIDTKKAASQAMDLFDATVYLPKRCLVRAGDYTDAKDADLLIVAAGPLPDMSKGQTRMDTLRETIVIIKDVVENIRTSGFEGIILNISNPADVVTHYIQHALDYPVQKIFSTSTTLDSARLRRAISEAIGVDQKSILAYALGEHGESQMAAWSAVTIGGKPLSQLQKEQPETYGALDLKAIAAEGKAGGWHILAGKGSTEFGIGAAIAEVVRAVFGDENRILPVSTLLTGQYGETEVYASVPSILNRHGVAEVIELALTKEELEEFHKSCQTMKDNFDLALTL
jgi:L-lactate dehydrogenase